MTFTISSIARRIRFQHIYVFFEVLKRKSILSASKTLHLSQPTVTKLIQDLEKHVGQSLFVRTAQGVYPTDFGLMFEQHANSLMADLRFLVDDLNSWNSGISGRVVLGTMLTASADFLPRAIMRLKDSAPKVSVEVKVGVNESLYPELSQGELDLMVGLLPSLSSNLELEHHFLYDETLCAVVGRQHELASTVSHDWLEREGLSWLIPPVNTAAGQSVQLFFDQLQLDRPKRVIESVSIMTNLGILVESSFIALMPYSVARRFVQLGLLTILPLPREISLGKIGYTIAKNRTMSPAVQRLIQALHDVCQES